MIGRELQKENEKLEKLQRKAQNTEADAFKFKKAWDEREALVKLQAFLQFNGFEDINDQNKHGQTPLVLAMNINNKEIFDLLLQHKRINIDQLDKDNRTPVWWAAKLGKLNFLKALVEAGADVTIRDNEYKSPFLASALGRFSKIPKFLIQHITGLPPDFIVHNRTFPLHAVCSVPNTNKNAVISL